MSLIKSISGIRGTIGGFPGAGLTPVDVVSFTGAFGALLAETSGPGRHKVVVGRDARTTGPMIEPLVINTLRLMGIDVIELGLATTPTVEMAVIISGADGGIILTASHNPGNWNALKLLNNRGEFLSDYDGEKLLRISGEAGFRFADVDNLGSLSRGDYLDAHINAIIDLPIVELDLIKKADFHVVVDAVNSVGGFAVPALLKKLGVSKISCINCEPSGIFAHNPEPLAENLFEISETVREKGADLGIVVDPDVDRLALVCEDGSMFGEEYTLVACADYVLARKPGNTVSNMSSSMALRDITLNHGGRHFSSAVGEVNVVEKMKETGAEIGGEGNGGVIYPGLHYGRDALVGIAFVLSLLAEKGKKLSHLRKEYPVYFMAKNKIALNSLNDADVIIKKLARLYADKEPDLRDGIKIEEGNAWVHIRKSNTEPILRIYSEASTKNHAGNLAGEIIEKIRNLMQL